MAGRFHLGRGGFLSAKLFGFVAAILLVWGVSIAPLFAQGSVQSLDELLEDSTGEEQVPVQTTCPGGIIQIMELGWDSAKILAHMHRIILEVGFECNVQIVPSDMSRATSLLAQARDPIVVPELWLSRVAPIWNELADQDLVQATTSTFTSAQLQGWYVPDFALEGAPQNSVSSFKNAVAERGGRVKFISCPPGWACNLINQNMFRAFEMGSAFELIEPKDLADMNAKIALSISKQEPVMFYYWEPSALMAQFDFTRLGAGAFNLDGYVCNSSQECASPSQSDFGSERVIVAVSKDLVRDHEELSGYLSKASLDIAHMNEVLSLQLLTDREVADLAVSLLNTQSEWQNWVSADRVARIQAYLEAL